MHAFEIYSEVLSPVVEEMKKDLQKLLRVKKTVGGLALPEGHAVIDLETTGLEPDVYQMVSYGIFRGSTAEVVIRLSGSEEDLIAALEDDLRELMKTNTRLWVFYSPFGVNWLETKLSEEFKPLVADMGELKQQKGRLVEIVPYDFGDRSDGSKIPHLWWNWESRASLGSIAAIIHHNMADIIREALLWVLNENGAFDQDFSPALRGDDEAPGGEGWWHVLKRF